jgi:hypothetical protein
LTIAARRLGNSGRNGAYVIPSEAKDLEREGLLLAFQILRFAQDDMSSAGAIACFYAAEAAKYPR